MQIHGFLISGFILACLMSRVSYAQGPDFALLDSSQAASMVHQCSRWAPTIDGSWNPSARDIELLETNMENVTELEADSCCLVGAAIMDPGYFARQYVGLIVGGKRLIYMNAFPQEDVANARPQTRASKWRKEPYIACGGGELYWGVLFDPATGTFHSLAVNGVR